MCIGCHYIFNTYRKILCLPFYSVNIWLFALSTRLSASEIVVPFFIILMILSLFCQ